MDLGEGPYPVGRSLGRYFRKLMYCGAAKSSSENHRLVHYLTDVASLKNNETYRFVKCLGGAVKLPL